MIRASSVPPFFGVLKTPRHTVSSSPSEDVPGVKGLWFLKARSFHLMNPFHEGISLVPLFILYLAEGASNLLECAVYGGCEGPPGHFDAHD